MAYALDFSMHIGAFSEIKAAICVHIPAYIEATARYPRFTLFPIFFCEIIRSVHNMEFLFVSVRYIFLFGFQACFKELLSTWGSTGS